MRCLMCLNPLEEIASDNLAIYRCPHPDCPLFRLYQAGLEEPDEVDVDALVERLVGQHKDEPPLVPVAEH